MNPARDLVLFLITALVFLSPLSNLKAAIDWLKQTLKNIAAVRACVMIASITLTIRERTRSARTDFFSARKSILGDWRKLATLIYTLLLALTSFDSPIAIANPTARCGEAVKTALERLHKQVYKPETPLEFRTTSQELEKLHRAYYAYYQAPSVNRDLLKGTVREFLNQRQNAYELLRKEGAPQIEIEEAHTELRLAQGRYIDVLDELIGKSWQVEANNDEKLNLVARDLADQGVEFKRVTVESKHGKSPGIEIIPSSATQVNRMALQKKKDLGLTIVYSPKDLNGAVASFNTGNRRINLPIDSLLTGFKKSGGFFHELKHAMITQAYELGIDHPLHGQILSNSPLRPILHDENAGPYQYARSFQEIGTFGLNMNLFRDSTDFKTIEKWARRGWGICSIDSKTIPKIQHALEEHLTGIGPELKDRPLKTIGWTSEGGRSGDMTLVEFSDHFGLGFAVDQTSFGEKIVNATVVSDDGVVILPLIGDGVLADYEALISKGGLTSDPELFAKIARRVIPLLQRKAENAAPTALMFQAVAENAQRVIAAPNDVPSFKALRAALGHFKGSKIMSDDHLN
jgi:hypothetical protein